MMGLKKSCAAFALLVALALPAGAADDWARIYESNNGCVYYLRRSSIEDNGSYVVGWVKCVLGGSLKSEVAMLTQSVFGRELSYGVILYGAKKGSRQTREIQIVCYDENGYRFFSMNENLMQLFGTGQWQHCVPDSDEEAVWEALMDAAGIRH